MDYKYLTPTEQLILLRPRLAEAERRHYEDTLHLNTNAVEGEKPVIQDRLDTTEAILKYLTAEVTKAEKAEAKAS